MRKQLVHLTPREDSHAGLLLQRYVSHPADGSERWSQAKRSILDAARKVEVGALYRIAFGRWSASLPNEPAPIDLTTQGRLIVGLGSENVLETGIRLHHTYGMPIIPGSALKGLAAHYCDQIWGERNNPNPSNEAIQFRGPRKEDRKNNYPAEPQGKYHKFLFGATDDSGCMTFHDAWYVPALSSSPLVIDVMTPHHSGWNNVESPEPPTDFDSPIPVPFLSVTGTFRVALSWHGPTSDDAKNWTELALSLLRDALKEWGIGGKTTSGYGRLVDPAAVSPDFKSPVTVREGDFAFDKSDEVEVEKYVDEKGKPKFRTPDGLTAHAGAEDVSDIPENRHVKMWVKNRNQNPKGYTLTRRQPAPRASGKSQGKSKGRRGDKGGRGRK